MKKTFEDLTEQQKERVAYLFADEHFGTDPAAFVYEWDGKDITGRSLSTGRKLNVTRARKVDPASVKVTMIPAVNITPESIQSANMHMDALAALVARSIYSKQGDTQ